jgi:hypothetical protein
MGAGMRAWQVKLAYSKNLGEPNEELAALLGVVEHALSEHEASVRGGYEGLEVTMVVDAADHAIAVQHADTEVRLIAGDHDLELGDIVEAHVVASDRIEWIPKRFVSER